MPIFLKEIAIGVQNLLPMCPKLNITLAVKIRRLGRKEIGECLSQVCLICEGFPTKVFVQRMEEVGMF